MTQQDLGVFTSHLIELQDLLDATPLTETRLFGYFEALKDLPLDRVLDAIEAAGKTCTFFPKPAELRTLAVGDADDRIEAAWMATRKAMRVVGAYCSVAMTDPVLAETILRVFGSWPEACTAVFSDEMWANKRKEFGRVFRVIAERSPSGSGYLPGLTEQQNGPHAEWDKFTAVFVIDGPDVRSLSTAEAATYRTAMAAGVDDQLTGLATLARSLPSEGAGRM